MIKAILLAVALGAASAPAAAQATISQGMTTDQVRAAFGAPATVRESGDWTYWYYQNGCPVRCGSDDVVFFRDDQVVAAVLRTRVRRFAGPRADNALEAAGGMEQTGSVSAEPAAGAPVIVGGVRVGGAQRPVTAAAAETIVISIDSTDAREPTPREGVEVREARPGEKPSISFSGETVAGDSAGATAIVRASGTGIAVSGDSTTTTQAQELNTATTRAAERDRQQQQGRETSVDRARRHDAERKRTP